MTTTSIVTTKLRPPWLNVTRALWIILSTAAIVMLVASTVRSLGEPLPSCAGAGVACGPWMVTREDANLAQQLGWPALLIPVAFFASSITTKVVFILIGLLVFVRRSDDWVAQMLSLMLMLFAVEGIQNLGAAMPLVNLLYAIATALFVLLPYIFPNGRFVPVWMRWVALPLLFMALAATWLPLLGIPVSNNLYALALLGSFLPWFLTAGYSAVFRYRRVSNAVERQQTKWVVAGILGTFLLFIPFTIATIWFPPATPSPERLTFMLLVFMPVYVLSYLCIPAGVAFAILRYRLWDIDVIIRKTLIYTALTAMLALVYFGGVVLLQRLFGAATGVAKSPLAIVISTLVIAALFTPLRRRIQDWIDRRFFRKKYDAQQVLARFALTARDETDLDALTAELARVVQETMQPAHVSVWLRDNQARHVDLQ
jgi:hypothetical protein